MHDDLKRLAEAATPGPWLYRPKPHDDWGFVRSVAGEMVAIGMRYLTDKEEDVHRANGTDPRGPNAKFIAAANPAAVLALLAEHDRLRAALEAAESEARRYADFYPQSSDGRNTFIILADRIAALAATPQSEERR